MILNMIRMICWDLFYLMLSYGVLIMVKAESRELRLSESERDDRKEIWLHSYPMCLTHYLK